MNSTFKEILKGINLNSEDALLKISDLVFLNEPISVIKNKSTEEAFNIFIGVQIIGCWKSGGWAVGVFSNFPEIVPYAPKVLKVLGLDDISESVLEIIKAFPAETDFSKNDQYFCDVINFIEGHDKYIVNKERFSEYSEDEKSSMRLNYKTAIEKAESLTENLWDYGSPNLEGWEVLITYLKNNINAKVWK